VRHAVHVDGGSVWMSQFTKGSLGLYVVLVVGFNFFSQGVHGIQPLVSVSDVPLQVHTFDEIRLALTLSLGKNLNLFVNLLNNLHD